jgi:hypothetical protein
MQVAWERMQHDWGYTGKKGAVNLSIVYADYSRLASLCGFATWTGYLYAVFIMLTFVE